MTAPARPRVICHMVGAIDGRIVTAGWPGMEESRREYERIHATFGADAWMCGRITMEPFAGAVRADDEVAGEGGRGGATNAGRPDFKAPDAGPAYAVVVDPSGRLAWQSAEIDGDHVVAVLTERVSDEYLAFLRSRGVSYLFAGARDVDLAVALGKLASAFGVRTPMLEGGGRINGAMMRDGLVDEVSLLVAPVVDGAMGTPALFDVEDAGGGHQPRQLALVAVERPSENVVWDGLRDAPPGWGVASGPGYRAERRASVAPAGSPKPSQARGARAPPPIVAVVPPHGHALLPRRPAPRGRDQGAPARRPRRARQRAVSRRRRRAAARVALPPERRARRRAGVRAGARRPRRREPALHPVRAFRRAGLPPGDLGERRARRTGPGVRALLPGLTGER
jgi:riboflavin biosynthesis pyrimidine reductase